MSEEDRRGLSLEVLAERVINLDKNLSAQIAQLMALFAGGTYLREDMYSVKHEQLRREMDNKYHHAMEEIAELQSQRKDDKKNIQDLRRIVFSAVIGPVLVAVILFFLFRQGL